MDENTRMMIQLASMMMQNQSAIRETQQEITSSNEGLDLTVDKKGSSDSKAATNRNGAPALGMDPMFMAEFARQIVMNSTHTTMPTHTVQTKRASSDKPTTIAQMIQSQNLQNTAAQLAHSRATSEGKIFVYNTLPDGEAAMLNCEIKTEPYSTSSGFTNGVPLIGQAGKRDGYTGPIRNKYGRVLRPGIDNFGSFESVANPGLIMQAMELMRQKDKKKRGPKEKETFSVFIYCLPDKNSKLPKFSSLDPMERSLVDQHQQEGYGYPSQDYINGIPRKTQLCLGYDEDKFREFMISVYPKLDGRFYDMYRIDKTRRLIRVDARSPRQLKDMKYQGSVIVIPYDSPEDQPAPIIHRNFDECYNGGASVSLGNPLAMIQNFNIPLPSLPESHPETSNMKLTSNDVRADLSIYSSLSHHINHARKSKTASPELVSRKRKFELVDHSDKNDKDINDNHNGVNGVSSRDNGSILTKISEIKSALNPTKRIHVRQETLFADILNAYREDRMLETHHLSVCFQEHEYPEDPGIEHDDEIVTGSIFVMFWEEAFRKYFTGQQDMVPVIEPGISEDMFEICGRILLHGLILETYLPLKFSVASLVFLLSGDCSDKLLLTSFYRCMSDSEKEVLEMCKDEIRHGLENFSPQLENSLKIVLGSYGCKTVPQLYELESKMAAIAKSHLIQQPYWALQQIQEGVKNCGMEILDCCAEEELVLMYQFLMPSVPRMLDRVNYIHSDNLDMSEKEEKVRDYFEQYMFKLTKPSLARLLYQWSGFDCLSVTKLFIKFSGNEDSGPLIFCPKQATICLPSVITSFEELKSNLESYSHGISNDDL